MASMTRIAIIVLAVLAAVSQAGCELFEVTIGDAIRNSRPAPDPDSRSLVRKRARMSRSMEAAFHALEADVDFVTHATYTDHYCQEGRNNWKFRTGYAHRCTIRITRYYGMSGHFRTQMIGFEKLLSTKRWTLPQASITETLRHQHGPLCASRSRPLFDGGHDAPTCALAHLAKPNEPYTKGNFQLFIVFADREVESMNSITRFAAFDGPLFYNSRRMFREITESYPYALAVAIEGVYFEN